jgi:hypothetical protein
MKRSALRRGGKTTLRKKLDKLFSLFVRQRNASPGGEVTCYTCPRRAHWKQMQNGHFVPRQYLATRYDEVNCQVQCYACNMLYNGQPSVFALRLERDYGVGTVARLESQRQVITKDFPYQEKIDFYKERVQL